MNSIKLPHGYYYVLELIVLIIGFLAIYFFSYNFYLQFGILLLILSSYIFMGALHHKIHHALKGKIVLEYILISALILAVFVFLNIEVL